MNIGEEQPPIELPLPATPEGAPESEPVRAVPREQPEPEMVPT